MEKRVIFPKEKQKEFLVNSRKELGLSWKEFAEKLKVKIPTLEKSYQYELCSLPYKIFKKILELRKIDEIKNDYNIKIIDYDPSAVIGRKCLGEKRTKLNEPNITFNKSIPEFDTTKIRLSSYDKNKNLKFPKKLTPELAEEIGIHVGDGFLSNKKNEYRLKGNKYDEKDYYNNFINELFKKLYNLNVNIKEYDSTYGFEICSQGLWYFKNKILGIPPGRKNNIELPKIIKVNDKEILCAFIRGIFDTDGYITFYSRYGFKKYYPSIGLSLKSEYLIEGVYKILSMLGFNPYEYKDKYGRLYIYLNGYERLERYIELIGWHNPKHLNKVKEWKKQYPNLGKNVMVGMV